MLRKYAQKLAESMAEVIFYDVIITDVKGFIIGSSKEEPLIGKLHEASLDVIRTRRGVNLGYEDVKDMKGTKPGVTYPIEEITGEVVGTVGISGEPEKVGPFALIVKKQAEMFLREKTLLEVSLNWERTLQNLISDVSLFDPEVNDGSRLISRGREFGFDLTLPHVAIAIDLLDFSEYAARICRENGERNSKNSELILQSIKTKVLMDIRSVFSKSQDISTTFGDDKYMVLRPMQLRHQAPSFLEEILKECSCLQQRFSKRKLNATIGIGNISSDLRGLSRSCEEAWQALHSGKKINKVPGVYNIRDYRIEELLLTSNNVLQRQFISDQLQDLKVHRDWPDLKKTIMTWCVCNFNMGKTADALHIHRSTLHYRLNKIENICRIDPRKFQEIINFYVAIRLDDCNAP